MGQQDCSRKKEKLPAETADSLSGNTRKKDTDIALWVLVKGFPEKLSPVEGIAAGNGRVHSDVVAGKDLCQSAGNTLKNIHITYLCAFRGSDWWG